MKKSVSIVSKSRWIQTLMVAATLVATSAFASTVAAEKTAWKIFETYAGAEASAMVRSGSMNMAQVEVRAMEILRTKGPEIRAAAKANPSNATLAAMAKLSEGAKVSQSIDAILVLYRGDSSMESFLTALPVPGSKSTAAQIASSGNSKSASVSIPGAPSSSSTTTKSQPKAEAKATTKSPAQVVEELARKGGVTQYAQLSGAEKARVIDDAKAMGERLGDEREVINLIRNESIIELAVDGSAPVIGHLGRECISKFGADSVEGYSTLTQSVAIGTIPAGIDGSVSPTEAVELYVSGYASTFNVTQPEAKSAICKLTKDCGLFNPIVVDGSACN